MPRIIDSLLQCLGIIAWIGLASSVWANTPTRILLDEAENSTVQSALIGSVSALAWASDAPTDWVSETTLSFQSNPRHTLITFTLSDQRLAERYAELPMEAIIEGQSRRVVFVVDPVAKVIGPVMPGMTLWRIAEDWRAQLTAPLPDMNTLIDALIQANPQAFERDDPTGLMVGAMLRLPKVQGLAFGNASKSEASEPVSSMNEARPPIAVPWRTIGTRAWIEAAMVRGLVDARIQASQQASISAPNKNAVEPGSQKPGVTLEALESISGQWLLLVLVVLVVMLVLHGFSRVGARHVIDHKRPATQRLTLSPDALATTLALAEQYLRLGDPAQAMHWLEEVIQAGDAKQVRSAKKLWREAQALFEMEAST